jgi:hypothetical protein
MALLAYGVSTYEPFRAARLTQAPDLGPFVAILLALLVARFLIWGRLTPRTATTAAVGGLLWTVAADRWGASLPMLVALAVVWMLVRAEESAARVETDT